MTYCGKRFALRLLQEVLSEVAASGHRRAKLLLVAIVNCLDNNSKMVARVAFWQCPDLISNGSAVVAVHGQACFASIFQHAARIIDVSVQSRDHYCNVLLPLLTLQMPVLLRLLSTLLATSRTIGYGGIAVVCEMKMAARLLEQKRVLGVEEGT